MASEQKSKGVTISYMVVDNTGRKNHYAVFAGPSIIGDVSGDNLDVMSINALDILSEASLKKRGLNRLEIEKEDGRVRGKMAEYRRLEREADTSELREGYRQQAEELWGRYTSSNLIRINVGLEMALCVGEASVASKEGLVPFNKAIIERLEKEGWKYRPF